MRIAFYAPMKPPDHAVPSGDRLMARLLIAALGQAGFEVTVASHLRSFLRSADDHGLLADLRRSAAEARAALADRWHGSGPPDLWFCYHPYYKAPDLLGPPLCAAFGLPYVTAEASYSERRGIGVWAEVQAELSRTIAGAAVNICMTQRDRDGLGEAVPAARTARLQPFIDAGPAARRAPEPGHLATVAMMRPGDKLQSYAHLAGALARLADLPWTLSVIGDGPARPAVVALFAGFAPGRIIWHGQCDAGGIAAILARAAVYVWPGCGEAYGLAYLEAQAAGLPVAAFRTAGVPEVVAPDETGLLVPPGDDAALAGAVRRLLTDAPLRQRLSDAARPRVIRDHSLAGAAAALRRIIGAACGAEQ